jgi:hypothetical protein
VEIKRRAEGIPYSKGEIDALHALAKQAGVDAKLAELV